MWRPPIKYFFTGARQFGDFWHFLECFGSFLKMSAHKLCNLHVKIVNKKSDCEEINFKLRDYPEFKVKQKTKLQIITSEVFYIRCNKNSHGKFQLDPGAS